MTVQPSEISPEERNELQDLHGVCWNTEDAFDDDVPEYFEIMEFHRKISACGHWYLPRHSKLKHEAFATELEAYRAAAAQDRNAH